MTSIYFGEEHESFRRTVRQFLETEVAPHAREWEEARRIPRETFRRMGDLGLLGILFPEELGGTGASIFHALAFLEELPRSLMGGFVAAVSVQQFIATGAIHLHGTREQKRRWLEPSIAGTEVGAIAISEPDTGSDVAAIRTTARRDGDTWVIDGAKTWITNGVEGDFVVVACRTDKDAGAGGLSLIVVEADTPGFSRARLRKMGWHSSDTGELTFENVRVPLGNLVGEENEGFYLIMETFVLERLVTAATSVGSCRLALEETRKYIFERQAFGRPIGKFQAIRHRLADLHAELEAAAQLVYHAAWLHEKGENPVAEACMAKLLATELSKRTADECLQFFGGFGTVEEYPIERFFRDSRFGTIVAGTSEIMREIISKAVLDGVAFPRREVDEVDEVEVAAKPAEPAETAEPAGPAETAEPAKTAETAENSVAGEPDAFAEFPVPPELLDADVTETLDAVFTEALLTPGPGPVPPGPTIHDAVTLVTGPISLGPSVPVPTNVAELFATLPLRFRVDRASGWSARFHFRFKDVPRSDWTVAIEDGACRTLEGHDGLADCVVTTTEKTYLAIECGQLSPETAFLLGKVKVSNIGAMTRFGRMFRKATT